MRVLVTGGSGFIGTNLTQSLVESGIAIVNVDIAPPREPRYRNSWRPCDILDRPALLAAFQEAGPTHVVHLAARTDTDSDNFADYRVNTEGTANVLEAIRNTPTVERAIITSTQFVHGPGSVPAHDEDFKPFTTYGQSKVIAEQLTRAARLSCVWTIVRPTNIWGPWHPRYPREFWRVLRRGLYVHPGREPVIRCYGYVGNVVHQIRQILEAPPSLVHERVFYLGDPPINVLDWTDGFSRAITGRPVRIVPRSIVRALAVAGDLARAAGIPFPIYSSRYRSMVTDYVVPMEPTFQAFGEPPYSMRDGIQATVQWLKSQGFFDA